ncbi:MAG: GntR family transcriptional regulator [Rubrivivax sp.]|nr:GntR family transcriptional regulator [Rubrivivax sp.]
MRSISPPSPNALPASAASAAPAAPAAPAASPARQPLAEQVYAALKQRMNDFLLVPGDRFSEAEMAARLGVSRTPVREALFRLRNEGLVDVESKSGWFVRPIDFQRIDQLYDLRVVLETWCVARLCTASAAVPELEALKRVWLVPAAERLVDGAEVGALDEQFHATLVRATGNAEIARVHWDVTERIRIVRRLDFTREDRIEATYQEHGKILRAIIQRKAEQALMVLRGHIGQSQVEVRKITLHTLHEARGRGLRAG